MILSIIINLCVLFTFSVLLFLYAQSNARRRHDSIMFKISIGVFASIIGLILIETSVYVTSEIIIDTRTVPIIISGVLGGPIALLSSGFLMGIIRMFFGGFTTVAIIGGLNTIVCTIILVLLTRKLPLNVKNAKYFFNIMIVQTSILIIILTGFSVEVLVFCLLFIFFTNISFYVVLKIIGILKAHFQMVERHKQSAITDSLTGLYNRRKLREQVEQFMREEISMFSIILLDIDDFKRINDTYGHYNGDIVLKNFAQHLQQFEKKYELDAFRFGGEFMLLLPHRDIENVIFIAEELREEVAATVHRVERDVDIQFTISSGVSTFPLDGTTIEELYSKADNALYKAKTTGKNRTIHIQHVI